MNTPHRFNDEHDRLTQILIDQALQGLDEAEIAELRAAAGAAGAAGVHDADRDSAGFEQVAAMALLGMVGHAERMPDALRTRVEQSGQAWLRERGSAATSPNVPSAQHASLRIAAKPTDPYVQTNAARRFSMWGGWLAAAACLALALLAWLPQMRSNGAITPADLRAQLIASNPSDLVQWSWTATDDPAAQGLTGDIVWSDAEQKGYMRFKGLARNDPTREQYQLWIFDANRKSDYPVDGGVFDVASDGEVIIPIDPKLHVFDANMFAVTVEKPGGVARSDRERIPALAKLAE